MAAAKKKSGTNTPPNSPARGGKPQQPASKDERAGIARTVMAMNQRELGQRSAKKGGDAPGARSAGRSGTAGDRKAARLFEQVQAKRSAPGRAQAAYVMDLVLNDSAELSRFVKAYRAKGGKTSNRMPGGGSGAGVPKR